MKNQFKLLITAIVLVIAGTATAQNSALDYMNVFSTEYRSIQQDMWDYTSSVSHGKSARKVEKRRGELIQTSNAALSKAKSAKGFGGSTAYRDSVVAYFKLVNLVLKEDYAKIVDMEAIAEDSYDAMEAYMTAREKANDKLVEAGKMVGDAQKTFADANDINLIESSDALDQKMEISGQVYDHYNEVYLIFFKSFKQELYMMDAINRKDLSAIEQNRNALKTTAEEGLAKLDKLTGYSNDASLIDVTKELLKFYITEAEKDVPKMADYFLKTENFNKVKAAFDQKKERDRTKEDVDGYNKAVNEMNAGVETYNKTNDLLNTLRSKYIDNWNRTAQKYTDKHVPKGK
ncbi:MAG: hypothetical protein QE487_09940 [Fluviicola sp.]|nr:hypothetical protein [Fluviicola sp.]